MSTELILLDTVNDDLIALPHGAAIVVHCVADLDYLERHGFGGVALARSWSARPSAQTRR